MSHDRPRSEVRFRPAVQGPLVILCLASVLVLTGFARAATLCVNPHGKSVCYISISAAVAAAHAGDTITVAAGTYAEDVQIGKSLSLVGEDSAKTIINAKGLSNGIYIDGFDVPSTAVPSGLSDVVVTGFTIENANFEGILVQNASNVTIFKNVVKDNDQSLQVSAALCPGQPAFETNESMDCGEGIHLMGTDHSVVADNVSEANSGGILVTDETAAGHDNVITRNTVQDNPYACGITIASHPGYVKTGTAPLAFGMYHNTVSDNEATGNGLGAPGAGAGVGLYAPGPGNVTIYNTVIHNRLTNNGLPGVAVHNHAYLTFPGHPPNPDVNDNAILGNWIAGNAADPSLPTTAATGISVLGVTPITGLVISGNVILDESIDVAVNSASALEVHLNNLYGTGVGVENLNASGTVNATENWWGCVGGPGVGGCSTVVGGATVVSTPWLSTPAHDGW